MNAAEKRVVGVLSRGGSLWTRRYYERSCLLYDPADPTRSFWVRSATVERMRAAGIIDFASIDKYELTEAYK